MNRLCAGRPRNHAQIPCTPALGPNKHPIKREPGTLSLGVKRTEDDAHNSPVFLGVVKGPAADATDRSLKASCATL